jgi:dipeptidase E
VRLLLLSSRSTPDRPHDTMPHVRPELEHVLGTARSVLLVPYAGVPDDPAGYAERARPAVEATGRSLVSVADHEDQASAVAGAEAFMVPGGNTWALLGAVRARGLLEPMRARVRAGAGYVGWSAGANLACATIMTTNDMPVTDPGGFEALGLVPFQVNPHFTNAVPPGHGGETRDERIGEFVARNPEVWVAGLPEGTGVLVDGDSARLVGITGCRLFHGGREPEDLPAAADLGFLLDRAQRVAGATPATSTPGGRP